ncbi:beta-propeller fold lactonase family protein [Occallatibacter riparius]|uniref:YncE family protein n=1 Tax=Occallatibacter riparius TaxID=1002689 RepID=A0A9J7BYL4_9BACT|nr:YncE family protein [Occallatibacter riparius]UWZ86581.1 YncE family protein [Occallatibacter riparius]
MRLQVPVFLLAVLSLTISASAQAGGSASLLVLSKQDHTVAIVDPATLKVLGKAPVGEDPHEIVASADGRAAYVSNYGFGRFHTITVIDLVSKKQEKVIDLTPLRGPHGLAFADGKLWFTAEVNKCIGSYDPQTGKVDWILGTGQNRTHMLYVLPGAKRIVTTNVNAGTVSVLDFVEAKGGPPPGGPGMAGAPGGPPPPPGFPRGAILPPGGDWNPTVIPVGTRDEGFDVSPGGKQAWIANAGDGTVSVIDLDAKRVTATLDVNVKSANRLKFTPDGKRVLVSMLGSGDLVVIDAASHQVVKRVPIGKGAAGIQMQPDGARAYVACTPDNYVAVIDLKTLEVVGHIDAGGNPDGLAWAIAQ